MSKQLKNRYMHIYFVDKNSSQSAKSETPKCQIDTLKCTLEELSVLELVAMNPTIKQQELAEATGKSIATIKRIVKSLQDKNYIRRKNGKVGCFGLKHESFNLLSHINLSLYLLVRKWYSDSNLLTGNSYYHNSSMMFILHLRDKVRAVPFRKIPIQNRSVFVIYFLYVYLLFVVAHTIPQKETEVQRE